MPLEEGRSRTQRTPCFSSGALFPWVLALLVSYGGHQASVRACTPPAEVKKGKGWVTRLRAWLGAGKRHREMWRNSEKLDLLALPLGRPYVLFTGHSTM